MYKKVIGFVLVVLTIANISGWMTHLKIEKEEKVQKEWEYYVQENSKKVLKD